MIDHLFKDQNYPMPDLTKSLAIQTVTKDDKIVGVGIIQPIYEIIVALDSSQPKRFKLEMLQELMLYGQIHCENTPVAQWHAFVDPKFGNIIQKHFGFKKCIGEAFIKNLR